jgi:hypothetical protein
MSGFTVTPDNLEALQHAVLGLAAELDRGPDVVDGIVTSAYSSGSSSYIDGGAGSVFNGGDEGIGDFFQSWHGSLGAIGENMVRVARALGAAAERYAEVDDNVCLANP